MRRMEKRVRGLVSKIAKILFGLARTRLGELIVGWSFAHMTYLMPVERLYETDLLVAFHHPQPSHKVHVLIVPKRAIRSLLELKEVDTPVLNDVVSAVRHIVHELQLTDKGYRLIVNGGSYQDIGQLHFHLVSDT